MMTFKPCGISDMWLGYVNTCNYLIQQVLSLQLRTGCSSSWIRFRIVIPESCLIYVWQITTSIYAFFCWVHIFVEDSSRCHGFAILYYIQYFTSQMLWFGINCTVKFNDPFYFILIIPELHTLWCNSRISIFLIRLILKRSQNNTTIVVYVHICRQIKKI